MMSKKLLMLEIKGHQHSWLFEFAGDPRHIDEWRADGLQIYEVVNTIPERVANLGHKATVAWCFFQDIFNLKNPFSK